ncbi:MAG: pyridoxal-phosphate dependent enzyme [Planctomycetota bacterium]
MISRDQIQSAAEQIARHIRDTPVLELPRGTLGIDATLVLKLENMQASGSFKIRNAFHSVLSNPRAAQAGLVAASGGNLGIAVATVARILGLRARVYTPAVTGDAKRGVLRDLGAEVLIEGDVYAEAREAALSDAETNGRLMVHAFESAESIVGAGTLGPEIEAQAQPDLIALSVGGGGLAAGVASWFGERAQIVCAEPAEAPTLHNALAHGQPSDVATGGLAADALGCRRIGELAFKTLRVGKTESRLVSEAEIKLALRDIWGVLRIAAEPAAAVALAGVRALPPEMVNGKRIAVLICGGNVDPSLVARVNEERGS